MRKTFIRFNELRVNAQEKLKGKGVLEERLTNAVCVVDMMHENEVPDYKWENVKSIINSCRTSEPVKDEGRFRVSINAKSYSELKLLKRNIELL